MLDLPPFTIDDLHPDIDQETRYAISDLTIGWARFDSFVSQMVILAFGLSLDNGPILLGNMDTRQKLERLKNLYDHYGMPRAASYAANLKAAHAYWVDVRNTVIHSTLGGTRISAPGVLVFAPVRISRGVLGHVEVIQLHVNGIKRAAEWAFEAGNTLKTVTDRLPTRRSRRPPTLPRFLPRYDPNLEKKRRGKQSEQRKAPRAKSQRRPMGR
jgi:hypothetical protein